MANFVYKKAKKNILNGKFDFSTKSFRLLIVNSSYVPNQNIDEFVSDVSPAAIVVRSNTLQNITNTDGTIDADDITVTIPANSPFNAVVFYQVGVSDSDSRLLFYIDNTDGLPFAGTLGGVEVLINWSNSVSKILSL